MKKTILITCALKYELDGVKQLFSQVDSKTLKFKFLLLWTGNYNTIFTLGQYLSKNNIDMCLNIWVCGTTLKKLWDFFQVYRIYNLASQRETLVPIYFDLYPLQSICASEKIIIKTTEIAPEMYVDMESYGIDFICNKYKLPYAIFKVPMDTVSSQSKQVEIPDIERYIKKFDVHACISQLEKYVFSQKNTPKNLEKYKSHFSFTYAEFEIFQKEYNRCIACEIDFEKFYKKHKSQNKKVFLEKLKNL